MSLYCGTLDVTILSQVMHSQLGFTTEPIYTSWIHGTLIPRAMDVVDNYVGHNFGSNGPGTILLDGSGKGTQHISRIGLVDEGTGYEPPRLLPVPMIAITAISFNGVAKTATDFQMYDEIITYKNNIFPAGRQNIKIEGSWGYTSIPDDIEYVTAQICANLLTEMIRSLMLPDLITPILTGGGDIGILFRGPKVLTANEKEILSKYRFREYAVG